MQSKEAPNEQVPELRNTLYVADVMSPEDFKNLVRFFSVLLEIDKRNHKLGQNSTPVRTTTRASAANSEND